MKPFTEYYRLISFAREHVQGDFSYYWYSNRFTETVVIGNRFCREFVCNSVRKDG